MSAKAKLAACLLCALVAVALGVRQFHANAEPTPASAVPTPASVTAAALPPKAASTPTSPSTPPPSASRAVDDAPIDYLKAVNEMNPSGAALAAPPTPTPASPDLPAATSDLATACQGRLQDSQCIEEIVRARSSFPVIPVVETADAQPLAARQMDPLDRGIDCVRFTTKDRSPLTVLVAGSAMLHLRSERAGNDDGDWVLVTPDGKVAKGERRRTFDKHPVPWPVTYAPEALSGVESAPGEHALCVRLRQPEPQRIYLGAATVPVFGDPTGKVLVDGRDSGGWWFPQPWNKPVDPDQEHQGKAFADHLRGRGLSVRELGYTDDTRIDDALLMHHQLVVCSLWQLPKAAELDAYERYVKGGGRLLLALDLMRSNGANPLAARFGLRVDGTTHGTNILELLPAPETRGTASGVHKIQAGSGVLDAPPHARMLGRADPNTFLDLDEDGRRSAGEPVAPYVLGTMTYGKGVIVFITDTNLLEALPQPLTDALLTLLGV